MVRPPLHWAPLALLLAGCTPEPLSLVAVTFNTGTTSGLSFPPDNGGYGNAQAAESDQYYGNGLAYQAVIDDTRAWFVTVHPDVVAFQETFSTTNCPDVPTDVRAGFVCDGWQPGDPTVAQIVLGAGYQVACNQGKPDKCLAVDTAFGSFEGCDGDLCLDALDGATVEGCGSGSRVGRGVIDLVAGGTLTAVGVHGSSGLSTADIDCRTREFALVFDDLGDGAPAVNGAVNLVMGDLNTDPGRSTDFDASATAFAAGVATDGLHFITQVGPDTPATYGGVWSIDHVASDHLDGDCWHAGLTESHPAVSDIVYFDHEPAVCTVQSDGSL